MATLHILFQFSMSSCDCTIVKGRAGGKRASHTLSCGTTVRSIGLGALVGSGKGVGKGVEICIVSMKEMSGLWLGVAG